MSKKLIEAALFMAGRTLNMDELAKVCGSGSIGTLRRDVDELIKDYSIKSGGLEIIKVQDGYKMRVVRDLERAVATLASGPDIAPAMLKTLALIAYEQPITQSRIVKERGNRVYRYIKALLKEDFISAEKHKRTKMLRTTTKFKEYFQIKDLRELKNIEIKLEQYKDLKQKDREEKVVEMVPENNAEISVESQNQNDPSVESSQ